MTKYINDINEKYIKDIIDAISKKYISKKDVIDAISNITNKKKRHTLMEALEEIDKIKAADVQPVKHGYWKSSAYTIESGTVKCSNCKSEMYVDDLLAVSTSNDNLPNYCPNCGARMDGDTND